MTGTRVSVADQSYTRESIVATSIHIREKISSIFCPIRACLRGDSSSRPRTLFRTCVNAALPWGLVKTIFHYCPLFPSFLRSIKTTLLRVTSHVDRNLCRSMTTGNADAGDKIPLVLILPRIGWVSHLPCWRKDKLLRLTGSEIHSSVPVMRDPNR